MLQQHGRVLLSSESPLPARPGAAGVHGPVEDIHHLLAHAQLVVGESATMSSEAAVLGVPAVFIATTGRGYTDDEERRYGLVRHFTEDQFDEAVATVEKLLADDPRDLGARPASSCLSDKIDVTAVDGRLLRGRVRAGGLTCRRRPERRCAASQARSDSATRPLSGR